MAVSLRNSQSALPIRPLALKRRVGAVLKALGRAGSSLSVLVTDDRGMLPLNRRFRGVDGATNVLAFPWRGPPRGGPARGPQTPGPPEPEPRGPLRDYLGDVALSAQTVKREAKALGIPQGELFYFYLIHGILHLLGHDHELGEAQERAQDQETRRLLALIPHDL
ncbi:MAG: rRNA maturation RNase YbeY [Deltaproteobacteria bacterium]|nr:rRNA maturation RNase YbeY [Deltaproteobacteria bacterium]